MLHLCVCVLATSLCVLRPALAYTDTSIPLPDGFYPEGIAKGAGSTIYVGSFASNSIYAFDANTAQGSVVVPANINGARTLGLKFDPRTSYLYACGAFQGVLRVYDMAHGASLVQTIPLTSIASVFINDLIITDHALYITNSFVNEFYKVDLAADGSGALANPAPFTTIHLGGEYRNVTGRLDVLNVNGADLNSNGIETPDGGKTVLIVNSASGVIYKVDPSTGVADAINLDESALYGDGLLFVNGLLYVVLDALNIVKAYQLSADYTSGKVLCNITSNTFDFATTIAYDSANNNLYIPNIRFYTPYSVNNTYHVTEISLNTHCKCLWDTGCESCSLGLSCHNFGYWSQCVESGASSGTCVATNDWGCGVGGKCCNPSATCTGSGKCWLPCQYQRGYRRALRAQD